MKVKIKNTIIADILFWGTCLSIYLNIFDNQSYHIFQSGLIIVMLIISGLNGVVDSFGNFTRKHKVLLFAFLIWFLQTMARGNYFWSYPSRIISVVLIIFSGYYTAKNKSDQCLEKSFQRIELILGVATLFGIVTHLNKNNPLINCSDSFNLYTHDYTRMTALFVHPIPCALFVSFFLILVIRSKHNRLLKVIGTLIGTIGLLLTLSRSAWITVAIVILVGSWNNIVNLVKSKKIKKSTLALIMVALFGIVLIMMLQPKAIISLVETVNKRVTSKPLSSQMSFVWRVTAVGTIVVNSVKSGIIGFLFGNGQFSSAQFLQRLKFGSNISYNVATVDNSYISVLFDFGLIGFVFLVLYVLYTFMVIRNSSNELARTAGFLSLSGIIMNLFYEGLYWCNSGYIMFFLIGMIIYYKDETEKNSRDEEKIVNT